MPVTPSGAQRASLHRSARLTIISIAFALIAAIAANYPSPASAAGLKVVIVVGPAGSNTANYITNAKRYAAQARSYGANVVEIYSPNATWSKVKAEAQGAKVLMYLGHGNGYPSPYGAFDSYNRDGMGLNHTAGAGNSNVQYLGEYYMAAYLHLAPNAVVILNRLCYASGNSEWGAALPTQHTAKLRIDNYGAGFLRTGAKAVFAEGITDAGYILQNLFQTSRSFGSIFQSSPNYSGHYGWKFASGRTPGMTGWSDPSKPNWYYRSVIGNLGVTAATFRSS